VLCFVNQIVLNNKLSKILFCISTWLICNLVFAQVSQFEPNLVCVKYASGSAAFSRIAVPAEIGATEVQVLPQINWSVLRISARTTVTQAISKLESVRGVVAAEPDYIRKALYSPNDPAYQTNQYAPQLIDCPDAWNLSLGLPSVIIGFPDSGVDIGHPDLKWKIDVISGANFINPGLPPQDDNGHGTHVSGIAAADTNNDIGIAGICPAATILPVKVLDSTGSGPTSTISQGYMFATDHGANVINASLGGYQSSQVELDAVNYCLNKGSIFVAAAGNDGVSTVLYPAGYPGVVSVGATDQHDQQASFTNFGNWVDLAAPGVQIYSTYPRSMGSYTYLDGTSMATPIVAGCLAMLKSYAPSGTPNTTLITALENTSVPVGSWLQYGRVDLYQAMLQVAPASAKTTIDATAVRPYNGSYFSGTLSSLNSTDGDSYEVSSNSPAALTQTASAMISYNIATPFLSIHALTATWDLIGPAGSIDSIFIYDYLKRRYDLVEQLVVTTSSGQLASFDLTLLLSRCMRNGAINLVIQSSESGGSSGVAPPPYTFSIDQATLNLSTK